MAEHDFTVPYLEDDLGEVPAAFTRQPAPDGRSVLVEGRCPRCHGHTATEYRRGVPGGGTKGLFSRSRVKEPPDVLATEVLFCECGYLHPNQPTDPVFLGCGASWRVVTPSGDET